MSYIERKSKISMTSEASDPDVGQATWPSKFGANFASEFNLRCALAARQNLCAFLVSLAAFQRGLLVKFMYNPEDYTMKDKFDAAERLGVNFIVSDGTNSHIFSNTHGDWTPRETSLITAAKHLAKKKFCEHNVPTPAGLLLKTGDAIKEAVAFMESSARDRFVIKPFNGSLAKDTFVNLTKYDAVEVISNFPRSHFIIEEYIRAEEYRFHVVGDQCLGVFGRLPANIIGDGISTIEELVKQKNATRRKNPHLYGSQIAIEDSKECLEFLGLTKYDIPAPGKLIFLNTLNQIGKGGDTYEVTDEIDERFKKIAVAACKAVGAPNGGVDMLIENYEDPNSAYVLEVNVRPHLGGHAFPAIGANRGNIIAEALIDMYFPNTIGAKKHSEAMFDFRKVKRALASQGLMDVTLPLLGQDWIVKNYQIPPSDVQKMLIKSVIPQIGKSGCFLTSDRLADGSINLNIIGSPRCFNKMLEITQLDRLGELSNMVSRPN